MDKSHTKHTNKASNLHLEIQFTDNTTRFYCRVYYAEQFRKLRSIIFSEGEERYIRSLSHCVQWIARGGKSGSMFCKTHGIDLQCILFFFFSNNLQNNLQKSLNSIFTRGQKMSERANDVRENFYLQIKNKIK